MVVLAGAGAIAHAQGRDNHGVERVRFRNIGVEQGLSQASGIDVAQDRHGFIWVATQDGLRGFGIALVVAAIVLYGLNEILVRRSREPLLVRGIDVERLRVE